MGRLPGSCDLAAESDDIASKCGLIPPPGSDHRSIKRVVELTKVGAVPVILPPLEEDDDIEQILDRLDGIVLIGGADLEDNRAKLCHG